MDTTDPIRRVSVASTGQVQIRPGHLAAALMMAGDVTYDTDLLELGHVPGVGSRRGDPAAASRLAQAAGPAPTLATV